MKNFTRMLALALCLLAAATLAMMSIQVVYPAVIGFAAVVASTERYKLTISKKAESRLAMGVAILFALRWVLLPAPNFGVGHVRYVAIGILDYAQAYPIAQALLLWMVLLLLLRRGGALPFTLPLYAALVVILAGTMPPRALASWSAAAYQGAALALTFLSGMYFILHGREFREARGRTSRVRRNAYVLLSCFVLLLGGGLGRLVQSYGQDLDLVLAELVREPSVPVSPGFSGEGRLDRVNHFKTTNSDTIALHVTSESMPGYLRGKAFDTFDGRRWSSTATTRVVRPVTTGSATSSHEKWFPLDEGAADLESGQLYIEPAPSLRGAVFTNLETARVSLGANELSVDAHRIVEAGQIEPGQPYRVAGVRSADTPPDSAARATFTTVPADIDPRIRALAEQIGGACTTDEERVRAVVGYLNARCTYSLNPPNVVATDPITGFLFESRAGHCEFFATSAALLLRGAGVPCRYVTGFVSSEQNSYGKYWVARNKDAHAWVEAYIEGSGWTTVEATPANGVPQREERHKVAEFWEYASHQIKAAIAAIKNMDAREFANAAARVALRWSPAIAAVLALGVGYAVLKRGAAKRRSARARLGGDPIAIAMNRRLRTMDRKAEKLGLVRAASETLTRFAERIERERGSDLADWYRAYARARYGNDAEAIAVVLGKQLAR